MKFLSLLVPFSHSASYDSSFGMYTRPIQLPQEDKILADLARVIT